MNVCAYVVPIRRSVFSQAEAADLHKYFHSLSGVVSEVLVIDGSPEPVFAAHHLGWSEVCRHLPVDRRFGYLNDKVNGIFTGVNAAAADGIILADDDIRYTVDEVRRV